MAIDIYPYNKISLLGGTGISPGVDVNQSPLSAVGRNHNAMYAQYTPAVAYSFTSRGHAWPPVAAADTFFDVLAAQVPQERDGRGLSVVVRYSTTDPGKIKIVTQLVSGVDPTETETSVADTAGETAFVTIDVGTPTSGDFILKLQAATTTTATEAITIYGWCAKWQRNEASGQSDAVKPSGWHWAQDLDFAATEPLSVEHVNRLRGGPRTLFNTVPNIFFSAQTQLTSAASDWETSGSAYSLVMRQLVRFRRPAHIKFRALLIGSSGAGLRISTVGAATSATISPGYTLGAAPTNPWGPTEMLFTSSAALNVTKQFRDMWFEVSLSGGTGNARLYSLTGELVSGLYS